MNNHTLQQVIDLAVKTAVIKAKKEAILECRPIGSYFMATTTWFPVRGNNTDGTQHIGFGFSASRSNPIYGRSDTVQPPARIVNVWKRVS